MTMPPGLAASQLKTGVKTGRPDQARHQCMFVRVVFMACSISQAGFMSKTVRGMAGKKTMAQRK
jgi:hypothetical protein